MYWKEGKLKFPQFDSPPFPWKFIVPFFSFYVLFWLVPLVWGFYLSFQSDTMYGESHFVGMSHYKSLLFDGRLHHALKNTLTYTLGLLLCIIPLSLFIAHLLFQLKPFLRNVFTFCLLLPGLTPPSVLALLFLMVFSGKYGLLNHFFVIPLGFSPIDWIKDPHFIQISLLFQAIWRWTGFTSMLFLAGMSGIPKQFQDIARTEGAESFTLFRKVTFPLLKNQILFASLFLVLDSFILFEGAYVLLGNSGGANDAGLLFVSYSYLQGFSLGRFNYAAAMSMALVPPILLLVWLFSRLSKDKASIHAS